MKTSRFLVIQTSFIGDVILSTALIETLGKHFPGARIDFLLRKGNEGLLARFPNINELLVWDKNSNKYGNLFRLLRKIRHRRYDHVINLQRFTATGFLTAFSRGKQKIGFDKNPFAFMFTHVVRHEIGTGIHEVDRNHRLIFHLTDDQPARPKLYPSPSDFEKVASLKNSPYICIAPTSVWFTKQLPPEKWTELLNATPKNYQVYLLGGPGDATACEQLIRGSHHPKISNLAGKLSLLESAALMKDARMNYVNDSAPMHLASAMNAPCRAVFCSTIPAFGFGPLSDDSAVVETPVALNCRPCGLHGRKKCPLGHFKCAYTIDIAAHALQEI